MHGNVPEPHHVSMEVDDDATEDNALLFSNPDGLSGNDFSNSGGHFREV